MSDRESRVRMRAHELWEQEGRPEGRDTDHWERASREIDAEVSSPAAKKAPRARKSASEAGSKPAPKKRSAK